MVGVGVERLQIRFLGPGSTAAGKDVDRTDVDLAMFNFISIIGVDVLVVPLVAINPGAATVFE